MMESTRNLTRRKQCICSVVEESPKNSFYIFSILLLWIFFFLFLGGCAAVKDSSINESVPFPLRSSQSVQSEDHLLTRLGGNSEKQTRIHSSPALVEPQPMHVSQYKQERPSLSGKPFSLNLQDVPLVSFINEVFGNILKLDFYIAENLKKRRDLVSLRINQPQEPAAVYHTVEQVLAAYGVVIEYRDNLLYFSYAAKAGAEQPPLLVSGLALPSVPSSHRQIFQLVPLRVVSNSNVTPWLREAFKGRSLNISEDTRRNSILLQGSAGDVAVAVDAINQLDKPFMRGRHSVIIEPVFTSPEDLSRSLEGVLKGEGYAVSNTGPGGSIYLLPVKAAGLLLAFATDQAVLAHVQEWAERLDTLGDGEGQEGMFIYSVRNTSAKGLATVIEKLLPELAGGVVPVANEEKQSGQQESIVPSSQGSSNGRLVVDEARNTILFSGSSLVWERLLPIIREMDQPLKQVMIEVVVAEVTLNGQQQLGVEWLLDDVGVGDFKGTLQSSGLGIGSTGLSWYPISSSGASQLVLNAFAEDRRISLLSTPRLMVRSGETAMINVGSEVPVVTSQATASDISSSSDASILQNIQYRKTGVILEVTPVVYAGRQVDITLAQEVSEAQPNTTSDVSSPVILNRSIKTSLSLADGGSVLLGGMISNNTQKSDTGIPLLKDIPFLGKLFKVEGEQNDRTELLILVVPYVIGNQGEAEEITRSFRRRLQQ